MAAAFRSNRELRESLKSFFNLIERDAQPQGTMGDEVIFKPGGRFAYEVCFIESKAAEAARHQTIERLTRVLGPVSSDEKENDDLLWRIAAERALSTGSISVDQALETMFDELEKIAVTPQKFIGQNHAISFTGTAVDLHIGPVRAVKTTILEAEFLAINPENRWIRMISTPIFEDGQPSTQRIKPDLLWEVDLTASIKNTNEQAVWLVNVALGLVRIAEIQQPFSHPFLLGVQEADPFVERPGRAVGIVLRGNGTGIFGHPGRVVDISDGTYATLTSDPFKKYMTVFSAGKGSVAARIAQGLGWMTRGRQSPDRAERLLYFFTALEALLTNDDKTAPITQTIARHASVILAKKPEDRAEIAGRIRVLYGARSALVHAGKRVVTRGDAKSMQEIVEAVYLNIVLKIDPTSDFEKLNAALAKASYGGAWL